MLFDADYLRAEHDFLETTEDSCKVCCQCSVCGEDIYEGDDCYDIGEMCICEACIDDAHHYAELDAAI